MAVPVVRTAPWGYLRLRRPDYGDTELKAWIKRIRELEWDEVFVFFKHEDEAKGPLMAKRFLELAGQSAPVNANGLRHAPEPGHASVAPYFSPTQNR